jgi:hypothetical protein
MRLQGCRRTCCTEKACASNPEVKRVAPPEAAAEAIKLAYSAVTAAPGSLRFCVDDPVPLLSTQRMFELLQEPATQHSAVGAELRKVFSNPDALNLLFLRNGPDTEATVRDPGLDLGVVDKFYALVTASAELKRVLCSALEAAVGTFRRLSTTTGFFRLSPKGLRLFDVVLACPLLVEPQFHRSIVVPVLEVSALDRASLLLTL